MGGSSNMSEASIVLRGPVGGTSRPEFQPARFRISIPTHGTRGRSPPRRGLSANWHSSFATGRLTRLNARAPAGSAPV